MSSGASVSDRRAPRLAQSSGGWSAWHWRSASCGLLLVSGTPCRNVGLTNPALYGGVSSLNGIGRRYTYAWALAANRGRRLTGLEGRACKVGLPAGGRSRNGLPAPRPNPSHLVTTLPELLWPDGIVTGSPASSRVGSANGADELALVGGCARPPSQSRFSP